MKIKVLVTSLILGATLTAGVTVAASAFEANPTPVAATGAQGTISVDLTGEYWASNSEGQKISIYFWDDSNTGWGNLVKAEHEQYVVFVDYSLTFTPSHMKAVRYSPNTNNEDWNTDPWCSGDHSWAKWNESSNMDFVANSNIIIASTSYVGYAYVEGQSSTNDWKWGTLYDLNNVKLNGSNHVEYYAERTVTNQEEFGVKISNNFYGWGSTTFADNIDTTKWQQTGNNVIYTGTSPLDICIYFDSNAGTVYITDPLYAGADEWAQEFLGTAASSDSCTYSKNNWSASDTSFWKLDEDVRNLMIALNYVGPNEEVGTYYEKAVQRYDHVLKVYGVYNATTNPGGFKDFMGRTSNGKLVLTQTPLNNTPSSNNPAALIIVISSIVLAGAGIAFFLFKRKRAK